MEGLYWSLVELTYSVDTVPLVALANNGYLVAFVVVSSVMDIALEEIVVQLGALDPLEVKTCPLVPTLVNA